MEYRSKYKAEEIEAILDAKNNTGEGVDSNLDVMFTGQLQTKEVEVSEDTTIKADEGFLGLKEVSVKVSGGGGGSASSWRYFDVSKLDSSMKPMVMPFIVKDAGEDDKRIVFPSIISDWTAVTAFGVDDSPKLYTATTGLVSWSQMMAVEGLTPEVMAQVGIVEITESEFYAL